MTKIKYPIEFWLVLTQKDLEEGERGNCEQCPLARAFNRALKKKFPKDIKSRLAVAVGNELELDRISEDGNVVDSIRRTLPDELSNFVDDFDDDSFYSEPENAKPFRRKYVLTKNALKLA